ncbi:hypothetical protein ACOMHN_041806 [Nucella lapillus]
MATAGRGEEVDSLLICTICFEPYGGREAKLLPCSHTFCLPCLARLVRRGETSQTSALDGDAEEGRQCDSVTCPTCRIVIPLPPGGVTGFKRNVYLGIRGGEAAVQAVACTLCDGDQTAQFLCGQCRNHVCCQCRRSHDKFCQGSQLTALPPPSRSSSSEAQSAAQSMTQSAVQSTTQSTLQQHLSSQPAPDPASMLRGALFLQGEGERIQNRDLDSWLLDHRREDNRAVLTQDLHALMGSMSSSYQGSVPALSKDQSGSLPMQNHRGAVWSAGADPKLSDVCKKVEDLASQVTALQSTNTQLSQHVTLLSSAHSKLSTEHSALQREVTSLRLREKNDQLTSGQASLQREVRALRDKQAIAHQDLAVLTAEKDKACAGLAKLQTDVLSMQTDASLQQTDILRLKADHGQVAAKLNAVQTDTTAMKANIQTDITAIQTDITDMKANIQTDITAIQTNITDMKANIQTDITAIQTNITDMKANIQTDITAIQTDITDMKANVQTDITAIQTDITDMKANIQTDITAIQTNITDMKANIQTDITAIQTNITDMNTDITAVKKNITAMQTDTKALQGGEASSKKDVDQLKTDCGQVTSVMAMIQGKLSNLESRFATANTQVGFTAGLTQAVTTSKEQTLVCDDIMTNVGGGYNEGTGVFTAPVTGTYCFMATTTSPFDADGKKVARLAIVVGGEIKGYVHSKGISWSTGHTVVKVTSGQTVWLRSYGDQECTFHGGWWTQFSGTLLQADV